MESKSPPQISPPTAKDNTEVLSQRTSPGHEEVREAVKVATEGDTSVAEERGKSTPMETGDGGNDQFIPQLNIISEIHTTPESDQQPSSREGGAIFTGVLYQSGGAGHSGGSASECFHCGGTPYRYGYGG